MCHAADAASATRLCRAKTCSTRLAETLMLPMMTMSLLASGEEQMPSRSRKPRSPVRVRPVADLSPALAASSAPRGGAPRGAQPHLADLAGRAAAPDRRR